MKKSIQQESAACMQFVGYEEFLISLNCNPLKNSVYLLKKMYILKRVRDSSTGLAVPSGMERKRKCG